MKNNILFYDDFKLMSINNEEIIKEECYIFDFAPHRALRQLSSYAIQIDPDPEKDDETKVKEFIINSTKSFL